MHPTNLIVREGEPFVLRSDISTQDMHMASYIQLPYPSCIYDNYVQNICVCSCNLSIGGDGLNSTLDVFYSWKKDGVLIANGSR